MKDVKVLFEEILEEANNKYLDFILFEDGDKIYNFFKGKLVAMQGG